MTSTEVEAASSPVHAPVRLRVDVYEQLALAKGYKSVASQARWHGISAANMWLLRSGRSVPKLDTAMRMAADLGVAVEVIWERVTTTPTAGVA